MFLHLGAGAVVPYRDIIGVFDLDNVSASHRTRAYLAHGEEVGRLVPLGDRLPAALVVTGGADYLSPISAQTLQRRLGENSLENTVYPPMGGGDFS